MLRGPLIILSSSLSPNDDGEHNHGWRSAGGEVPHGEEEGLAAVEARSGDGEGERWQGMVRWRETK
jgi:hypothetical protein